MSLLGSSIRIKLAKVLLENVKTKPASKFCSRENLVDKFYFKRVSSTATTNTNTDSTSQSSNSPTNGVRYNSAFLARQFINTLSINERLIIKQELIKAEQENSTIGNDPKKVIQPPSWKQISFVCFQNGLPFIGFGFVDNFLMIVAGDIIESYIGIFLPLSTMAAAGFGNAISDVAGIGLAHHIEYLSYRLIGEPNITPEQLNLPIVNWSIVISKSLCIFIGCIIGMFPLLFIKHENDHEKKEDNQKTK